MSERSGLTLKEALDQLTDAEIRHAHQESLRLERARQPNHRALRAAVFEPVPVWLRAESNWAGRAKRIERHLRHASGETALNAQLEQVKRHRRQSLLDKLLSGDLIATGIECPRSLNSERRQIPKEFFGFLKPDFRHSRLHGHGMEIIEVRIHPADVGGTVVENETAPRGQASTEKAVVETPDESEIKVPVRGRRGRPGLPPDFGLEMRRRAKVGQLFIYLSQEAKYLHQWGVRRGFRNPQGKPWPKKTIENNLRDRYRVLKARNRAPK
jgi:hypothetical protein